MGKNIYFVTTSNKKGVGASKHYSRSAATKAKNKLLGKGLRPTIKKVSAKTFKL